MHQISHARPSPLPPPLPPSPDPNPRPEIQKALQQVLYASSSGGGAMSSTRLSVLVQSALGSMSRSSGAFIDLDTFNGDLSVAKAVRLLLSDKGASLRGLLVEETVAICDTLLRQNTRRAVTTLLNSLPRPPFVGRLLPRIETVPLPVLVPAMPFSATSLPAAQRVSVSVSQQQQQQAAGGSPFNAPSLLSQLRPVLATPTQLLDSVAPKLSREEELYALALSDASAQFLGNDARSVVNGDAAQDPLAALRLLVRFAQTGAAGKVLPGLAQLGPLGSTLSNLWALVSGGGSGPVQSTAQLDELLAALGALEPAEQAALNEFGGRVGAELQSRLVTRLQVLR